MATTRPEVNELTMVRRDNVLRLMRDGGWDRKQFSKKTGVKYATLSSFCGENPKSNIGDKTARLIEEGLSKPEGYLSKDRRNGVNKPEGITTLTMQSDTLTLEEHPISKFQRDAIINLLFGD